MLSPDLANHPVLVLIAYTAVFIPWTAVAAKDFINGHWRSVRDSRRDGLTHLFFVIAPSSYITFYIYLQIIAKDYKEMAAAIAGLVFSLLHLSRTVWGLWQLYEFRLWATRAIESLQVLGYQYELHLAPFPDDDEKPTDPWSLADRILVNDSLMDNQLYHGEAQCYIKFGLSELRLQFERNGTIRFADLVKQRIRLCFLCIILPPSLLIDRFLYLLFGHRQKPKDFRQMPVEPIELYLKWAAAFVAQGLKKWLEEFHPVRGPDTPHATAHLDNRQLFQERQEYFVKEVLSSAAFHMGPPSCGAYDVTSPMIWCEWGSDLDISDGRATFRELLELAVKSGEGLPFGATQTDCIDRTNFGRASYKPYARKLERYIEGLPAAFGEEVISFGTAKLEWLSVLLFIGSRGIKYHSFSRQSENDAQSDLRRTSSDWGTFNIGNQGEKVYKDLPDVEKEKPCPGDLALENLETQLGIGDLLSHSGDSWIANRLKSIALGEDALLTLSNHNRLNCRVGEIIDNWLTLTAGEQIEFMLDTEKKWKGDGKCNYETETSVGAVDREEDTQTFSNNASSGDGSGQGNESVQEEQRRIEKERLEFQFAKIQQRYFHIEQSLTFMGYSMECVRSALAGWRQTDMCPEDSVWKPEVITHENPLRLGTSQSLHVGAMSNSFACELRRTDLIEYVSKRSVQVHLLGEIQGRLVEKLRNLKGGASPSSLEAISLCILSFPSLVMKARLRKGTDSVSSQGISCTCITIFDEGPSFKKKQKHPHCVEDYVIDFDPICGPQGFLISASFQRDTDGTLFTTIWLARKEKCIDCNFVWEWWRDAFTARLVELTEWQRQHKWKASTVHITKNPISANVRSLVVSHKGLGENMNVWLGWMPFRTEICLFELQSPNVLTQYRVTKKLLVSYRSNHDSNVWYADKAQHERVSVTYPKASREQLKNACFVVTDIIEHLLEYEEITADQQNTQRRAMRASKKSTMMIDESKMLMERGGRFNLSRAVLLLEIAALELGNVEAIELLAKVCTSHEIMTKDVKRVSDVVRRSTSALLNIVVRRSYLQSATTLDSIIRKTHDVYADWATIHLDDPEVVAEFVGWTNAILSAGVKLDLHAGSSHMRRAFLHSRDIASIFRLGMMVPIEVISMNSAASNTGHEADSREIVRHDRERQLILRIALLDRAAKETGHIWARYFLALDLLRLKGGLGTTRTSISLLETLIKEESHAPSMFILAKLFSKGKNGNYKNVNRAIELYERALKITEDVHAKVKLADLLCSHQDSKGLHRGIELYLSAIAFNGNTRATTAINRLLQEEIITQSTVEEIKSKLQ